MQKIDTNMVLLAAFGLFLIYLLASMLALDGWVLYRLLTGQRVFPAAPLVARRPVPWGLWTILSLVAMTLILPVCVYLGYAKATGQLPRRSLSRPQAAKGPARTANEAENRAQPAQPPKAASAPTEKPAKPHEAAAAHDETRFSFTESLAIGSLSSVILLILAPLVLRLTTRSPLRDIGLNFKRWWLQVAVGVLALLAIDPLLLGTQLLTTQIWKDNPHPLFKMIREEFSPGVPQLAILLAVIVAPIWEELLFRGVIQSWLISRFQLRPAEKAPVPEGSLALDVAPEIALPSPQSKPEVLESGPEIAYLPQPAPTPALPETGFDFPNPFTHHTSNLPRSSPRNGRSPLANAAWRHSRGSSPRR